MLIGLISDTHVPLAASFLPPQIKEIFRGVDLILHAGDLFSVTVIDELRQLSQVLIAEGDDDYPDVVKHNSVKLKHILTVDGITIWLQHTPVWYWPYETVGDKFRAKEASHIKSPRCPDIIVHGHTHIAKVEDNGGVLVINPGSPTLPRYRRELGTIALLNIESNKPEVEIIQLH